VYGNSVTEIYINICITDGNQKHELYINATGCDRTGKQVLEILQALFKERMKFNTTLIAHLLSLFRKNIDNGSVHIFPRQ
jgi:hypothetical protein